ncbi:sugar O-acetyltransferase [Vagococcus lutrae]|uniref:sugar O-acetyltransferase n=1 Tax=Vagococcus lutrae TaxID=81947 RepID=UPI000F894507|nr:sugar O-acetyltransferase [Vagococcus lutrae]RST91138.1 maltose O-acetyltransferase [Vagococcus lutrae]
MVNKKSLDKQKMLASRAYQAGTSQLAAERLACRQVLHEFNQMSPTDIQDKGMEKLATLFGASDNFFFEPPFRCDYGYNIHLGKNVYANFNLTILDCQKVEIGDDVMFGPNVSLFTASHPLDATQRHEEGWEYAEPIKIGNRVWIGGQTVINPNVTIGDDTVIGSGSVVTKDIPSGVIAVGNPCKVLRSITDEDRQNFSKRYLD